MSEKEQDEVLSEKEKDEYLKKLYFDPRQPASFQSAYRLYKIVKEDNKHKLSLRDIKDWLQNYEAYSRNKLVKRNFQRNRVIVSGIDDQFEIDLASLIDYGPSNDDNKYLLCVIDVFSRFGFVQPIENKTPEKIIEAFDIILAHGRIPNKLRSDKAKDFTSKKFKEYCKEKGINHFVTQNEKQANYVERFIKTIKSKIYRYVTHNNTMRYIDVLPQLVESYNNTFHTGIQSKPIDVNKQNERKLWWQMYLPPEAFKQEIKRKKRKRKKRLKKFTYNVDDHVRITFLKGTFDREYDMRWSAQIFKIRERFRREFEPIYKLNNWFKKKVDGTFYQAELQKVDLDSVEFKIHEVIKYRGPAGKKKQAFVSWVGWPKEFDSWILASRIKDLE